MDRHEGSLPMKLGAGRGEGGGEYHPPDGLPAPPSGPWPEYHLPSSLPPVPPPPCPGGRRPHSARGPFTHPPFVCPRPAGRRPHAAHGLQRSAQQGAGRAPEVWTGVNEEGVPSVQLALTCCCSPHRIFLCTPCATCLPECQWTIFLFHTLLSLLPQSIFSALLPASRPAAGC